MTSSGWVFPPAMVSLSPVEASPSVTDAALRQGRVPHCVPDHLLDAVVTHIGAVPPHSQIEILRLGGAVARVPADATAFGHRSATWPVNIIGLWEEPDAAALAVPMQPCKSR